MTHEKKETTVIEEEREEERLSTADVAERLKNPDASVANPPAEIAPLLVNERASDFRSRWDTIQTSFVDEPRQAVERADSLVAEVMQELAKTFAEERQKLEAQWGRGDNVSTEDLRIALQRYRSFFTRLLSI
jgi:hypothetical protein